MRWIPFLIVSYVVVVLQCSVGKILVFDGLGAGPFGPDLVVILALFIGLYAGNVLDGVIAGWILGMLLDLTTAGFGCRVGPMSLLFSLCIWMVFSVREAVFRDRAIPQMLIGAAFVLVAHGLWVTLQSIMSMGNVSWGSYGTMLLQVLLSSVYTALLTPLVIFALVPVRKWLMTPSPGRRMRTRR
jgi:rod shape-determining protein MreD